MGWSGRSLPAPGWFLYTRGGTNGVFVQKMDGNSNPLSERVEIPPEVLKSLVADDIRNAKISALEQMEDDEILGM